MSDYQTWREWRDETLPTCTDRAALLAFLNDLAITRDRESAHGAADDALLVYINDPEITAAFAAIPKYYI